MDEQVVAVVPQSVRGSDCLGHAMPCPYPHVQSSPCRASDGQLVQTSPTSSNQKIPALSSQEETADSTIS